LESIIRALTDLARAEIIRVSHLYGIPDLFVG